MRKWIKPLVFLGALVPLLFIAAKIIRNDFGPDPVQELAILTGEWALRFLILALAMTPAQQLTGIAEFTRNRRMIGLYAFFYASVHFLVWLYFLLEFRWAAIGEEIIERPFVTVGFSAWIILLVLAATSPKFMVRRLRRRWKPLHRLVYLAAILAIVHQLWIQRTDLSEVVLYGSLVALLLGYRLVRQLRMRTGTA